MKPIQTTLLMGLIAVVASAAAAVFYPWPTIETTTESSGNLFDEFKNQVWTIKLVRYDRDSETVKSFSLRRKGQKWIVPSKSGFVATGQNIAVVASCLNEKNILGEQSEDQQDHEKFGVLDPVDFMKATNRDSLGVKITLADVNNTTLGSLIIGDQVRGAPNQRYVRKPGQPKVFIVEFDPEILSTEFGAWVEPNMLNLQTNNNPGGVPLEQVSLQNYRISSSNLKDGKKDYSYRAQIRPFEKEPEKMLAAEVPGPDGQWEKLPELDMQQRRPFGLLIQAIQYTPLVDVRPKEKALSKLMTGDIAKLTEKDFKPATDIGFRFDSNDGNPVFDGANGKLEVATNDGVVTSIILGSLASSSETSSDSLNYYMIIVADIQGSLKQKPVAPIPAEGETLSDDEAKKYARDVENWEKESKAAKSLASELNRIHGGWYYIIGEDVLEVLRPAVPGLVPQTKSAEDEGDEGTNESSSEGQDQE